MWKINPPKPVKLIIGILAADSTSLAAAVDSITAEFGQIDFLSDAWDFFQTDYYKDQTGENIIRQFAVIEKLIDPSRLAEIKHRTNGIEQNLAEKTDTDLPRPVNLDPGIIEPSKFVLASTKNFSHRIYIGQNIYAEITLIFSKQKWLDLIYTYPDYKQEKYHKFFNKVREKLITQQKQI